MLQNAGGKKIHNSKKAPNYFWFKPVSLFESVCNSCLLSASDYCFWGFLGCIFWLYLCYELLYSFLGFLEVGGCVVYICGLIANSFPENIQNLKFQLGWLAVNAHICCVALFQFLDSMSITTVAVWILRSTDGIWKASVFSILPICKDRERDRSHSGIWMEQDIRTLMTLPSTFPGSCIRSPKYRFLYDLEQQKGLVLPLAAFFQGLLSCQRWSSKTEFKQKQQWDVVELRRNAVMNRFLQIKIILQAL